MSSAKLYVVSAEPAGISMFPCTHDGSANGTSAAGMLTVSSSSTSTLVWSGAGGGGRCVVGVFGARAARNRSSKGEENNAEQGVGRLQVHREAPHFPDGPPRAATASWRNECQRRRCGSPGGRRDATGAANTTRGS